MSHGLRHGVGALRALATHRGNAPLSLLERMALSPAMRDALHARLRMRGIEAVVLSTCHRTELYYLARVDEDDAVAETLWRARLRGLEARPARLAGHRAGEHLFRVAAGLESLVLGETEVLGQLRSALESAERSGSAGPFLSRVFHAALRLGGRARSETGIGTGARSIASAAVRLLGDGGRDLRRLTVLVIGAGTTGIKAARHLTAERVGRLVLLNRTPERARRAADELGVEHGGLDDLASWLAVADGVVAAVHVGSPMVHAVTLRKLATRRAVPLTLVDLSLPRAIEPACGELPGVRLHNLSDLEQLVSENRSRREAEIPRVEALLRRELEHFVRWADGHAARARVESPRGSATGLAREQGRRAG